MLPDALDRMATLSGRQSRNMANPHVPVGGAAVADARSWHDR